MLDAGELYSVNAALDRAKTLTGLPMIAGFTGFAEAGQVVSQIRTELFDSLDHELVASFDADQLLDYRGRRPRITFKEDHLTGYRPPRLELYRLHDGLGQPFLFLTGFEPDYQWERFIRAVLLLVDELDVSFVTWTHSIPMPVPHTRPLGVTVHGNRPDLIEGASTWRPTAELAASVGHLLEVRLVEAGHDVVGYVVHVPHYLAEAEYPQAAVAALEYLGASTALMLPTDRLRESGREVERQIREQVEGSNDVMGVVTRLERHYDEHAESRVRRSLLVKDNDELADADELGAAVEAYLASTDSHERTPGAAGDSSRILGEAAPDSAPDCDLTDQVGPTPDGDES
ncbi:proteasome assembly chaperone family protein [Arthrobacter roseus]|uniref:proteasome assembly chaperone family protein n=1 Tax=Arthrobacter roseus TaxID=136274 RepID=UPI001964DF19|nr:PAC2 family protein [Arthrobacter roseus]MBM7848368.1 hypothetical protein [Arthrobacter roseus]